MIPITNALRDFLASTNVLCVADLYTFFLNDGTTLRYTSSDVALEWDGNTYQVGLRFKHAPIKLTTGLQVDDLSLEIEPSPDDLVGNDPFLQLAVNGGLDGCYVQLDYAFLPTWDDDIVGIVP